MKKVVEELRRMIEIDMKQGRTWVVDYAVLRCKELGYCAFCGKKTEAWSTSGGCMNCYRKRSGSIKWISEGFEIK